MVVVGSPLVYFMSGIGQAQKPVLIETAIPEFAVEALDEGILNRTGEPYRLSRRPVGLSQVTFLA